MEKLSNSRRSYKPTVIFYFTKIAFAIQLSFYKTVNLRCKSLQPNISIMKKILLLSAAAFITATLLSYTLKNPKPTLYNANCYNSCFTIETKKMIELDAAKPGFTLLHPNPKKIIFNNPLGKMIQYPTSDGTNAQGYFIPSATKSNKWLIVIQEWWGLNDNIKHEADIFYKELGNMNVIAVDMYDGKVATVPDSAMKIMRNADPARLENIIKGAISLAGKDAKIYTVGWCFGGGWSLQASILAGNNAAGCVMYYGRPEENIERLKTIHCDVIGFFGNKDQGITPDVVNRFEKNMKEAEKNMMLYRYDAGHGFANPSNPSFNKEATEDAHQKAIAFLKKH